MADEKVGEGLEDTLAEAMVEQKIDPQTGEINEPSKEPQVYTGLESEGKGRQDPDRQPATQDYPREGSEDASEEDQEESEEKIDPRGYWNKEQKDFFERQSPDGQRTILSMFDKMQYVYDRKTQDLSEAAMNIQSAAEYISPFVEYKEAIEEYLPEDMDFNTYIDELVDSDYIATNDPVHFVCQFMVDNNIHVNDVISYGAPFYNQVQDPNYQRAMQLAAENEQLQSQMIEQQSYEEQVQAEQMDEVMDAALFDFQNERDENGEFKYPYLSDVEEDMAYLMETTGEINLPSLYEKACWLNPDIREELIAMRGGTQNSMPNMARGFSRNSAASGHGDDLDSIIRNAASQPGMTLGGKPL